MNSVNISVFAAVVGVFMSTLLILSKDVQYQRERERHLEDKCVIAKYLRVNGPAPHERISKACRLDRKYCLDRLMELKAESRAAYVSQGDVWKDTPIVYVKYWDRPRQSASK